MPVEVLRELQRRLPDVQLWNFYGQTEMAPLATILRPHEQLERAGLRRAGRRSTSRRGSSTTTAARSRRARSARSCTAARTPRSATTRTRRRPPRRSRGGWFHSGDLGVMTADGYLSVVDRKKDMIKTGGENVASREVEEAIYSSTASPRSRSSASATRTGSRRSRPSSCPEAGATLTEDDVHAHARERLAAYKRPKYVVLADALPKNPSGKILKRELRATYAGLAAADG